MTTETNAKVKSIFETTTSTLTNRTKNTLAAAAGAVVGVGLTAMSDRSNTITLGATAAFGALSVMSVHHNDLLNNFVPPTTETKIIIGSVIGIETALFGCVMNLVAGDTPEAE